MYFASKPAFRSMIAVLQPTWKPYTQNTTTGSDFDSSPEFLHEVRVAPGRTVHDVLQPRHGVPPAGVDDLHWLASLEHRFHFLYADAGHFPWARTLQAPVVALARAISSAL